MREIENSAYLPNWLAKYISPITKIMTAITKTLSKVFKYLRFILILWCIWFEKYNAYAWQGFSDLFQTFKGLDDTKYIDEDIKAVEDLMMDGEGDS
jgi:hypothetical protein